MKLNAKITELISATEYTDSIQRVKLKVEGADAMYRSLIVPNEGGYVLDDEVVLLVLTKADADSLFKVCNNRSEPNGVDIFSRMADQLRPDETEAAHV